MNTFSKIALAAAATLATAGAAQAATIVNGSFENGVAIADGGFVSLSANDGASIQGWTVGNTVGGVDYIGTYWQAADGARSIDLAGSGRGSIYQDVATDLGQQYVVTFDLAGNPDGGANMKIAVTSIVGGDAQADMFTVIPGVNTRDNMGWQQRSYAFTAMSTTSRLTFASANGDSPYGPALDNVSIAAVPEPATWGVMLLGIGMIGAGLRQRRRAAVRFA